MKKCKINSSKLLIVYLLMCLFSSCSNGYTSEKKECSALVKDTILTYEFDVSLIEPHLMDSLLKRALYEGNCSAYKEIYMTYFWKYRDKELLYYSFIMANKYNCPEANFHIYYSLAFPENEPKQFEKLDSNTKNIAFYYLLKSYELGYENSKSIIEKHFGKNKKIPKSSDYLKFK